MVIELKGEFNRVVVSRELMMDLCHMGRGDVVIVAYPDCLLPTRIYHQQTRAVAGFFFYVSISNHNL